MVRGVEVCERVMLVDMFCGEFGLFLRKRVVVMDLYERFSKDEFIK